MRNVNHTLPSALAPALGSHPRHRSERGSALTELVILVPVIVGMFYGSIYLSNLGVLKLRAQETVRYAAWAMAARPLSDYQRLNHSQAFARARESVTDEMHDVYDDLDGANHHLQLVGGREEQVMRGAFDRVDLFQGNVSLLPASLDVEWADPGSDPGIVLNLIGIGTSLGSLGANILNNMDLNGRGQITARTSIGVDPPLRPQAKAIAKSLSEQRLSVTGNANMSRRPSFTIKESDGRAVTMVLIADNWRVQQGFTAAPGNGNDDRNYGNVVDRVAKKAISALPLGALFGLVTQLPGLNGKASNHLFSRPYVRARQRAANYQGALESGQVNIFRETGGSVQEGGNTVTNFESGAFLYDAQNPDNSGYVDSMRERGNNFMGCPEAQTRGCWE